ncbi:MAG: hypothetical protein HKN04_11425 [Rhodothermaceae bacterium]|nr:hypothetical protein [Rhodothermaceae bacterium]
MIAVVTGTVKALEPGGLRIETEHGHELFVTSQIPAAQTGLVVGDRITAYGGPDPKQPGIWLSSGAYLDRSGQPSLDVPLTEFALTLTREAAARGEPTIFTRTLP